MCFFSARTYEPNAQKVCRLLRYTLTGILGSVQSLAQRGPDEAAERPPKGVGWLAISLIYKTDHRKITSGKVIAYILIIVIHEMYKNGIQPSFLRG